MSLFEYCRECDFRIGEDGDAISGYCSRCASPQEGQPEGQP